MQGVGDVTSAPFGSRIPIAVTRGPNGCEAAGRRGFRSDRTSAWPGGRELGSEVRTGSSLAWSGGRSLRGGAAVSCPCYPAVVPCSGEGGSVMVRTRPERMLCLRLVGVAVWALAAFSLAWGQAVNAGVALIIGNKEYEHRDVPEVSFAHRDAQAFRRYVIEVLGFDEGNIIDLRDATRRELFDALGTRRDARSLLWSYLDPEEGSEVVVYYSGHGVAGLHDERGYLLPVDADPSEAEDDGYPIDLLYRNVGGLAEARSVRVYLDACFSGGSHEGGLIPNASPVFVEASVPEGLGEKVMSLAAASGEQVASWDEGAGHGLFTHHLLDALYGGGDADGDGGVTAEEVKGYLDRHMTRAARRQHRRIQQASLLGAGEVVLASAGEGGVFPRRPTLDGGAPPADGGGEAAEEGGGGDAEEEDARGGLESAQVEEEGLGLSRAQRVLVQKGLGLLGYAVGRADGVFGERTRGGIVEYQKGKGLEETGHLTKEQAEGLMALGEEAEAERKAAEAERKAAEAERRRLAEAERKEAEARAARERAEAQALMAEVSEPEPGHRFRDCDGSWCLELVVVPAGEYRMGSPSGEAGRWNREGPVHRVEIGERLAVGVYEVTVGQWRRFVGETGYSAGDGCWTYEEGEWEEHSSRNWERPGFSQDEGHPVVCVSWKDAQAYVEWLSRKTGKGYRLLSESEWEYVARGGTETAFHTGETISTEQANYNGNSIYGRGRRGSYRRKTVEVGSFGANGFGLHDVHGNVWEWVEDCWNWSYDGAPADGSAWTRGDCGRRVLRGGSWYNYPRDLRSANRNRNSIGNRSRYVGFRIVRTL